METSLITFICIIVSAILGLLLNLVRITCRDLDLHEVFLNSVEENMSRFSDFSTKSLREFHFKNHNTTVMLTVHNNGNISFSGENEMFRMAISDVNEYYHLPACVIVYYTGPNQKHTNLPILQNATKDGGVLCPVWFWGQIKNIDKVRKVDMEYRKSIFRAYEHTSFVEKYINSVKSDPKVDAKRICNFDESFKPEYQAKFLTIIHIDQDQGSPELYWKVASGRSVNLHSSYIQWFSGMEESHLEIFTRKFCAWYMFSIMAYMSNRQKNWQGQSSISHIV